MFQALEKNQTVDGHLRMTTEPVTEVIACLRIASLSSPPGEGGGS